MPHGGKREGAGRKVASHTLKAATARKYLIQEVIKEMKPLASALINQGKKGNINALKEIFDRTFGRVTEKLKVDFKNPLLQVLIEISDDKKSTIKTRERIDEKPEGQEVEDK